MARRKSRWKEWLITLIVIAIAIVILDYVTDTNALAVPLRIVYQSTLESLAWTLRVSPALIPVVARRQVSKFVMAVLYNIGIGYVARVFLGEIGMQRLMWCRSRYRSGIAGAVLWWNDLETWRKFVFVIGIVVLQILIVPTISQYVVFFPVRFMVPVFSSIALRIYGMISDTIIVKLFWMYCGRHWRPMRRSMRKKLYGRQALQFRAAWRLWRHHPEYRDESGERWVSIREPYRLWRQGKLDVYRGRPLLSGKKNDQNIRSAA